MTDQQIISDEIKIIAIIPAHMSSVRFPGKILHPFFGHPMIEHVRRRAQLASLIDDVYVATCDEIIADTIRDYGGKVIMTGNHHKNGTTRVAEAVKDMDCSHVILLQGDEPLLKPDHVDAVASDIIVNPDGDAWNATATLDHQDDMDRHSFVKCAIGHNGQILYCFRRCPSHADFTDRQNYIKKIMGIIAYRKDILFKLISIPPSFIETTEFIEQMRLLDHGMSMQSVPLDIALPSVNEPNEGNIVIQYLNNHPDQQALLKQTFGLDI